MDGLRVMFAGGGTGGHLFPGIAIAEEIKKLEPSSTVVFVGTKDKIEARVVPQKGFLFETIWISGFHRRLRFSNIVFPIKVLVSLLQSYTLIKKYRPDVVVGTGGYVSGPIGYMATLMNIPTLIHEQNSYPGVTTRLLGSRATRVCITFEQSKKYLKRSDNVMLSGNPTRSSLDHVSVSDAKAYFGFDAGDTKKTLFVFGGSLGAATINSAMMELLPLLNEKNIRIIWQTGKEDIEKAQQAANKAPLGCTWVSAFIDRMDYAYAASDLVLCRAGATTIAELTRLGKPAILIPYPFAAADHQTENAKAMKESGAAIMVSDKDAKSVLFDLIFSLVHDDATLQAMGAKSKLLGKPTAALDIAKTVISLSRKEQRFS